MSQTTRTPIKLRTSGIVAASLFALDAFVMNQGAIAFLMLVISVFILLPIAVYHQFKYRDGRQRYMRSAVYASAALLVFGANYVNNSIAQARARELVEVIERYHTENENYPKSLQELVPRYIDKVPRAKFAMPGEFYYATSENGAVLFYMELPPFGRSTYDFEKRSWGYLD